MQNPSTIKIKILQIIFFLICSFAYAQKSELDSAYDYFQKASAFDEENKHFEAYKNYTKSLTIYKKIDALDSIAKCNLELFSLLQSQNNLNYEAKPFLDEYYQYALQKKDSLKTLTSYFRYAEYYFDRNPKLASEFYHKAIKYTHKQSSKAIAYANLALLFTETQPDSASFYFKKNLELIDTNNRNALFGSYINYANFFQKQGNYNEAIVQLKKAEAIEPTSFKLKFLKILYKDFADCYSGLGDYKNAYHYFEKYQIYNDSLNFTAQNIAISDLDVKYQTAEKEKKILEVETKNKEVETKNSEQKKLIIGGIIFLFLIVIISFLIILNIRKKELVAEQEKEIERQKNLTLLKEQELGIINAMIEGQEKERKHIAEDLHDNIGSVLATLKLHFENLKLNREKKEFDQEKLYEKTENLIDETYKKVRNIAHAKNAGVIANVGLLHAIELMASKISDADKIQIEVVHFGLDKRLENRLEITIFRIVQELITNIMKHAEASNATINISLYDNVLNLIIEDNGKGFDPKKIKSTQGMGLDSIEKRIENLGGTFDIDSTNQKGATIIINIPIE
ncbi:MAG: sensor histidine kinase [Polaribacter sp.]|nr:sensor histidine kinase [Polaribacter sp.]